MKIRKSKEMAHSEKEQLPICRPKSVFLRPFALIEIVLGGLNLVLEALRRNIAFEHCLSDSPFELWRKHSFDNIGHNFEVLSVFKKGS